MIRYRNALQACALAASLALAAASRAAFWVSPGGDDGNPGTEEQPLRTIERARDIIRTLNTSMTDDITVFISGLHQVTSPIEFGPEDSGSNGFSVVYMAAPGERPAISGAVRVTDWTLVDKARNLWSAPAPIGMRNGHELFVNGARTEPTRIRVPAAAADPAAPPPPRPAWRNPDDIAYPPPDPQALWSERSSAPLYAVNVFEALGSPGTWCLDRPDHRIYYTPRPGEDMGTADAEVALAPALVVAGGSKHVPLTGLVFKGIRFEYTAPPSRTPAAVPDAAVLVTRAASVQFLEDTFIHLSTPGLSLGPGFEESAVTGCVFGDITWTALSIAWASQVTVSDSRFTYVSTGHLDGAAIAVGHSQEIVVEHNQIDHYPASALLEDGEAVGALNFSQNLVSAPSVGIDAGPRQSAAGTGTAGVTPAYQGILADAVIPRTAPLAPAGICAEAEDGFAYVAWDPPTLDGGSDIVSYRVTASTGAAITVTAPALREKGYAILDGLDDGTEVSFSVRAANASGTSPESPSSGKVVPAYKRRLKVPKSPASVSITLGMHTSEFRITPPASNGGSPVVAYSVAILSTGAPVILQGRDILHADASHPVDRVLDSLVPGAGSAVEVRAINAKGQGDALEARAPR